MQGRGRAYAGLGQHDAAIRGFDKALSLDPANDAIIRARAASIEAKKKSGEQRPTAPGRETGDRTVTVAYR